jgi:hypothetical protein
LFITESCRCLVGDMKQGFILIMCLILSMVLPAQEIDEFSIPDQYIVQLNGGIDGENFFSAMNDLRVKECLSKHMNIWLVQSDTKGILHKLQLDPSVKVAQYNHDHITRRSIIPNDSLFNLQWNMLNTANPGADISTTQAWQLNHSNVTQTGDSIVIAVIDGGLGSGFDIYHPDINFFVNHQEIPNNGRDDDGNGYIDDYHGWNIFGNNDSVYATSDPHATHVSGIAAAIGNNHIGVAGVCWGAKVLAVNGASNTESDVVRAYDYVLEMRKLYDLTNGAKGAFVVATNSSFGIDMGHAANFPIWCAMYDSLGKYGILSATATANNAWNVDNLGDIPTTCPSRWMIAVTNTTRADALNSQAGYGPTNIDLGAPGTSITSCYPDSSYGYDAGTSMASPHVAGAIAAMFANACPQLLQAYFAYPDSIALLMRDYLLQSVDPLSSLHNITSSGGRLNLYHAFIAEDAYNCNNCQYPASLTQTPLTCYGDSTAAITISAGTAANAYHYLWSNGQTTQALTGLKAGFYEVTITDTSGCPRQLSTLIYQPLPIVVSSVTVIPIGNGSAGNIVVNAKSGNDTISYAMDNGSYASSAVFATSVAGVHTIYIRNQTGCVYDTTIGLYYTGVNDIQGGNTIKVYPNPSTGLFYISGINDANTIEVFDLLGQRVISHQIVAVKDQVYTVDLKGESRGVYFYRITDQSGAVQQGKLVVQ